MLPRWHNRKPGWIVTVADPERVRVCGVPIPGYWRRQSEITMLDPILTLQVGPRSYVQPDRHYTSDGGSIPPILRWLPGLDPALHPEAYQMHDSMHRNGCVYRSEHLWGPYEGDTVTRAQADELLRLALLADGATRVKARAIWAAVRMFGRGAWRPTIPIEVARRVYLD
jgi:hypothetical protein